MKSAFIVWCSAGMMFIATTLQAAGMCAVEAGGCRDLQTGKLYVRSGDKYIDPETNEVFMENEPVRVPAPGKQSDIRVPRTSVRAVPESSRDPATGKIIQPEKRVFIQDTEKTIVREGTRPDGPITGTATHTFTRTTTCRALKDELNSLNSAWISRKDWDRVEVGERIDKLESQYRSECR